MKNIQKFEYESQHGVIGLQWKMMKRKNINMTNTKNESNLKDYS